MKTVIRTAETHPLTWRLRDDKQPVWLDEYRSKNGRFRSVRELENVAGIGSATVDKNIARLAV